MCELSSPEMHLPRETDCGIFGSAEPVYLRRRPCRHRCLELTVFGFPGVAEDGMPGKNVQRKLGTTRGSPRRSRTAKASRISRYAVKSRCARGWGGWGRLSDDGSRQHNSSTSEDPWGGGYPTSKAVHERALVPTQRGITEVATKCAKGGHKPPSAGVCREQA